MIRKTIILLLIICSHLINNISIADTGYMQSNYVEPIEKVCIEVVANISAYTASPKECGNASWSGYAYHSNKPPEVGTIAMDGVPENTIVEIEIDGEVKTFIVKDKLGHKWSLQYQIDHEDIRIDMYVETTDEAWQFGRQYKPVKIYM